MRIGDLDGENMANMKDPNEFTCREMKVDLEDIYFKNLLNLGCGRRTFGAFHNVDYIGGPGVNQVVDLLKFPWPWDDDTWDYILISHWLEHILFPHFFDAMDELIRISADGALIEIKVPHFKDPKALASPGHCRLVSSYTLRPWINKKGFSNECQAMKKNMHRMELLKEGHIGHFKLGSITDYHWRKYLRIEPPRVFCHSLDYFMILKIHKMGENEK